VIEAKVAVPLVVLICLCGFGHSFAADPITVWDYTESALGADGSYCHWTYVTVGVYPSWAQAKEAAQSDFESPWQYYGSLTSADGYGFVACVLYEWNYGGQCTHAFFRRHAYPLYGIMPEQTTPIYSDFVNESRGNYMRNSRTCGVTFRFNMFTLT
jgi:hypothetical protein